MAHPVEQVDGLGLGVVVGLDLLLKQRQQERLQLEVAVEQAELLQHDFPALQALGALVFLELLVQVSLHRGAGGELTLDRALDGQPGLLRGELEELIDQRKQLLRPASGVIWVSGFLAGRRAIPARILAIRWRSGGLTGGAEGAGACG